MDQGQRAAEPTPTGSLGDLRGAEPRMKLSEAAEANRLKAAHELSMIGELRESAAFAWFEAEFIDKPFKASSDLMRADDTVEEATHIRLLATKVKYLALKRVKAGMIERQIVHLKRVSPGDPAIAALTQQLRAL